jgi:tetratricopeptide (TPR) repeat protein
LQYLWDNNFIQTPSPTDSTPSSQSSSASSSTTIDYFLLEPSAREYVRTSLTPDEKTEHAWLACNVCVDGIRKSETQSLKLSQIHDFGRVMAPHAKACYDDWYPLLMEQHEHQGIAWHVLGNVCMTQGVIEQAIGCFELSLAQRDEMDPVERMETSLSLARLLEQDGQHGRSKEVLAGIDIESLDEVLGFRVAMARASASVAEGELGRAEDEYESLEHEQEQVLGPTDTATVNTVHRLASTLEQLGKMEEAQALFRRVYISYQNMLGHGHPMTLEALEDLAYVSMEGNAIDKAEALYKRSVEVKTKTLGAGHPSTARAIVKLAVIDDMRSRYGAARAKYQKALAIMAPTLGRAHPLYTTTLENLALSTRWHGHAMFSANDASSASSSAAPARPAGEHRHNTRRSLGKRSSSSFNAALSSLITASSLTGSKHRDANDAALSAMDNKKQQQQQAPVASTPASAFREAETLYLEVVATKKEAAELYPEEQVVATGSKLREMYESEAFFEGTRGEKVAELMKMLRRKSAS